MPISNDEKKLRKIFKEVDSNEMVLPNFQRGFVWDRKKQKNFLSSILVGLPIGSLLLLEGKKEDFSKRRLCYPEKIETSNKKCTYILDGQQRLSTLRTVFYDVFEEEKNWEDAFNNLYGQLRTRWFLRIIPEHNETDVFGYNTLTAVSLNRYTDTDIDDFVEYRVIHRNKHSEPEHPAYSDERKKIAKVFAEKGIVPLWELNKKNTGLHQKVLQYIGEKKIRDLKDEAERKKHSINFYTKVFKPIDIDIDEIKEIISEIRVEDIETTLANYWARLLQAWSYQICKQLEESVDRNMPYIHMTRDEVDRAVAVFEAINKGGSPLSVYDLIVAKSAQKKKETNLSVKIIEEVNSYLQIHKDVNEKYYNDFNDSGIAQWLPANMGVIEGNEPSKDYKNWFVNTLSIIVYIKNKKENIQVDHIKKDKHLNLTTKEVNDNTDRTVTSINRALAFLQMRCGVINASDVSYKLMLIVLAYYLYDDSVWHDKTALNRLEYWYWTSLLGGAYYTRQNEKCIDDIGELDKFLKGKSNRIVNRINTILDYPDYATKDILLRRDDATESEQKSVKTGILQYILSKYPKDMMPIDDVSERLTSWNIACNTETVDIHHIVPLANVAKIGETTNKLREQKAPLLNSVVNLTYISRKANNLLREKPPARYLEYLEEYQWANHFIPPIDKFKLALENENYEDVLERRFEMIKNDLYNYLTSLV